MCVRVWNNFRHLNRCLGRSLRRIEDMAAEREHKIRSELIREALAMYAA